jgi:ADP-ribose pyrophosphatase YjhB (NUDIX family)
MKEIEFLARGVFRDGGRVLVCRNRKKGNCYLPGGHIEWNESAPAALAREMREETVSRGRRAHLPSQGEAHLRNQPGF